MIRFSDLSGDHSPDSSAGASTDSGEVGRTAPPANEDAVKALYQQARETVSASFRDLDKHQGIDLPRIEQLAVALAEELAADDRAALCLVSQQYDPHRYLEPHSVNVFLLAVRLAQALEVSVEVLRQVGTGALLHDAGMLWVPEDVRDKPGRLSPSEERLVRTHPDRGREALVEVVKPSGLLESIVLEEHEQPDGKGYPHGLREEETGQFAKLVRVADFLEAYTHARAYRPEGHPPTEALRALVGGAGNAFDPAMVKLALDELTVYPVGTRVELSTGEGAEVVAVNRGHLLKPVVLVVEDAQGHHLTEPRLVDLTGRPSLYIRGLRTADKASSPAHTRRRTGG